MTEQEQERIAALKVQTQKRRLRDMITSYRKQLSLPDQLALAMRSRSGCVISTWSDAKWLAKRREALEWGLARAETKLEWLGGAL